MSVRDDRPDCRCGHPYDTHEHHRPGTDCGACGKNECPAYNAPSKFTLLLARNRQLKRRLAELEHRIAEDEQLWRNLRALAPFTISTRRHPPAPRPGPPPWPARTAPRGLPRSSRWSA